MKVWDFIQRRIAKFGSVLLCVVDPDKFEVTDLPRLTQGLQDSGIDGILIGGTLLDRSYAHYLKIAKGIKDKTANLPLIIFPGATGMAASIVPGPDAMLFLQLISGHNPHYLISEQMIAGLIACKRGIETIATGYVLVKSPATYTMEYITNTQAIEPAIPADERLHTGLRLVAASQCLGHKLVYFEHGSDAPSPLPVEFAKSICPKVNIPVMTSGGIKTPQQIITLAQAGVRLFAVGTIIETCQDIRRTLLPLVRAAHWKSHV